MPMNLLPFERLVLESRLSPDVVVQRLEAITRPVQYNIMKRYWQQDEKTFEGTVNGYSFRISRIIHYRNSFLPMIRGTIEPGGCGSRLRITMHMHPLVIGFTLFILGNVGFAGLAFLAIALENREYILPALIPIGMCLFIILLSTIGFQLEARKARQIFLDLLEP